MLTSVIFWLDQVIFCWVSPIQFSPPFGAVTVNTSAIEKVASLISYLEARVASLMRTRHSVDGVLGIVHS